MPVSGRTETKERKQKGTVTQSGQVIPFKVPSSQKEHEQLLGLMAALGPLLWFGHEFLVWLKLF